MNILQTTTNLNYQMKALILITIALLTVTTQAIRADPSALFHSSYGQVSADNLDVITSSQLYMNKLSNSIFYAADYDHNGYLTKTEFQSGCSKFLATLYGITAPQTLIDISFVVSDILKQDKLIDKDEFNFFTTTNLVFL